MLQNSKFCNRAYKIVYRLISCSQLFYLAIKIEPPVSKKIKHLYIRVLLGLKTANRSLFFVVRYAVPPSPVRDLVQSYRDYSSVRLQWLPPAWDGGRTDVRYRVDCIGCDEHVTYTPRQSNLHGTASVLYVLSASLISYQKFIVPRLHNEGPWVH